MDNLLCQMQSYENFSRKIKTLFIGQDFRYLPICHSTNAYAFDLLSQNDFVEGTTILTDCQTAGRGQQNTTWEAEPHQNITLSVILCPTFLKAQEQFFLNIAVTLAIYDFLSHFVPDVSQLKIKWANDLLYNKQKICGVLIQNVLSGEFINRSVVGIGVNINQRKFTYQQAVSLSQLTGLMYDLPFLVENLLKKLESRYLQLRQKKFKYLREIYYERMFGYQSWVWLKQKNQIFQAKICGVDEIGRLQVVCAEQVQSFQYKEVEFLLEQM